MGVAHPTIFGVESDTTGSDVNFAEFSLTASGSFGTGVLATVTFDVIGLGSSALTFNDVILSQPFGIQLVPVTLNNASVNAVPEPGTMLLLGTGLATPEAAHQLTAGISVVIFLLEASRTSLKESGSFLSMSSLTCDVSVPNNVFA